MAAHDAGRINLPRNQRIKDGRIFEVSKRARTGEIYLRCSTKFCSGTAKKLRNGNIKSLRDHSETCFADRNVQLTADFKDALKSALARNFWKLKQVYETVASLFPREIKIEVPFHEILSSLKRWRKQFYPPCPETLQSMADQLEQPENQRLLEYDVGKITTVKISDSDGNLHLLMFDPQFIAEFANVTHIFIDGTFQTTPQVTGAYQLVSILGIKYDHAIPIAHILMAKKTENSYTAVLNSVKTTVISGETVAVVMTDFEQALRNACRNAFPRAIVAGCSVHYDRAILKKVKALRLTPSIRQDEEAKLFLKKIMALAFLPAAMIPEEYARLKNALPAPLQRLFTTFLTYYERQWLRKVKPSGFSVFRLSRRTNNVIECYNSVLKDKMGQHPSAWTFIGHLIKLTSNAREDLESLRRNKRIRRHPRYVTIFRRKELTNAWNKLISKEITVDEFLDLTAGLKGHVGQALMRLPEENDENEALLEEGPEVIAPDADPDYDEMPEEIDNNAEPAFNHDADPDYGGMLRDIDDDAEPEVNHDADPDYGGMLRDIDGDAEPEVNHDADPDYGGMLRDIDGDAEPEVNHEPDPDYGAMLRDIDDDAEPEVNHESDGDLIELSSATESETDDEYDAVEIHDPPHSPHAAEEVILDGVQPPPAPPLNLPVAPAGTNNASKSRKKNLRKKRRRQEKAQIGHIPQRPRGHKRRAKRRKLDTQAPKCVVCLENTATHGFVPCGHTCSCVRCATVLDQAAVKRCPKCRANFREFIAIYNEPP